MDDLELSKRVLSGDRSADTEFIKRHYTALFRYLRVLTGHDQDAEDLSLETLMSARNQLAGYRGASSLRSWIHRIGFRRFLRWRRFRRLSFGLSGREAYVPSGYADADHAETLRLALNELPESQRQAFILHEILEFDLPEIASVLRVPVGTVKSRLFHARNRLRTVLTPNAEELSHGTQVYER